MLAGREPVPVEVIPRPNMAEDSILEPGSQGVGIASLAPRKLGGTVGPDLTIYGTTKLSVAANSIMALFMGFTEGDGTAREIYVLLCSACGGCDCYMSRGTLLR